MLFQVTSVVVLLLGAAWSQFVPTLIGSGLLRYRKVQRSCSYWFRKGIIAPGCEASALQNQGLRDLSLNQMQDCSPSSTICPSGQACVDLRSPCIDPGCVPMYKCSIAAPIGSCSPACLAGQTCVQRVVNTHNRTTSTNDLFNIAPSYWCLNEPEVEETTTVSTTTTTTEATTTKSNVARQFITASSQALGGIQTRCPSALGINCNSVGGNTCNSDYDCLGRGIQSLCCPTGCGYRLCRQPANSNAFFNLNAATGLVVVPKPGLCPANAILDCNIAFLRNGVARCQSDVECYGTMKCCQTNFCGGMTCKYPYSNFGILQPMTGIGK